MATDDTDHDARRLGFARLVAQPDRDIDLAQGALLIAAEGRPPFDPSTSFAAVDALVARATDRLGAEEDAARRIEVLHAVLYRDQGFRAPRFSEAQHPDHSRLDRVLERRVGLPISLAIVELTVGWRLGLALHGVGLPGHFVVGGPDGLLVDPAGGGRRLARDDCQALVRRALGPGVLLNAGMLRPAHRREILARVLRNLRVALLAARDWPAALGVVELLAIVEPTEADHVRDRGLLLGRVGRYTEALAELRRYRAAHPEAHDIDDVGRVIGIFGGRRN